MIHKMNVVDVHEGQVSFKYPALTKECTTWYKSFGFREQQSVARRPLVVLHGGPGHCHNYLLSLTDLASKHGIPVIFYDQIGNGNSTHLREKRLNSDFWTPELFIAELDNLVESLDIADDFDLYGQSWGGMLAAAFAIRGHKGLKRLVISNSPVSMDLWLDGCNQSRKALPREVDSILQKYEDSGDYENQAYKDACMYWYKRHMCRVEPWPDYVLESFELNERDDTVYFTMNGPSEFTVIGNLRPFDLEPDVHKITVPTLVLNGEYDAANDAAVAPLVKKIPQAEWHRFEGCSHMCHVEERDQYMNIVARFLKNN